MASDLPDIVNRTPISRRLLLTRVGLAAGAAVVVPRIARAQTGRRWRRRAPSPPRRATSARTARRPPTSPIPTSSPSIPTFNGIAPAQQRRSSACGPARSGRRGRRGTRQGRYLVWSDIPNNRQLRWLEDDGRVSVFRMPSNNSNGNTFDFQGRQLSCEHLTRRVVRYEHDGSITVIADAFNGKRLNSPNDVVPHPDGSYWFTDPPYGGQLYEGAPDAAGGPSNPAGRLKPELGQPPEIGDVQARAADQRATASTRAARSTSVVSEDQVPDPERPLLLARLQEALRRQHRQGPGRHGRRAARATCTCSTSARDNKLSNRQALQRLHGRRRQVRARRRALRRRRQPLVLEQRRPRRRLQRRHGVDARRASCIGRIRLPEVCGNVCFGGPEAQPPVHGRRASRSTPSTSTRRAPRPARPRNIQIGIREPALRHRAPGSRSPHPRAPPTPSRGARRSRRPP